MMVRFKWYFDPLFPHQLQKRQKTERNVKIGPPLTEHSGSAHVFFHVTSLNITGERKQRC